AILHPSLPAQAALLLRYSAIPRLHYVSCVIPPNILRPSLQLFDSSVLTTIINKLHLPSPLPDVAQSILRLPIRLGGCGFRSLTSTAPAAYLSSIIKASSDIL